MDFGLRGKTALVMASTRGLGFATALKFAEEGANVIITGRTEDACRRAVSKIQERIGTDVDRIVSCPLDVTELAQIEAAFQLAQERFGGVDILVTNAGGPPEGNFSNVSDEAWEQGFQLTLMSVVRSIRLALPHMKQQKWGRIVLFTSSSIKQPLDNLLLSNTFRAGLVGLAKSIALEVAKDNVLVNTLGPGRVYTDRIEELDQSAAARAGKTVEEIKQQRMAGIPMGRYGEPAEFASVAVFLASAANGYMTGQAMLVDGGMVRSYS